MTQQAMGHYDGCSSLQLKIYEKIPIPDLPVSTMMEVHGHYFITQIAILLNLTVYLIFYFFVQVIFPHKKLSFRILDIVRFSI